MGTFFKVKPRRAGIFLLIFWKVACVPQADAEIMQRIHAGIEGVARGMDYMGRRAEALLGPGMGDTAARGGFSATRQFEEQYPVGVAPTVILSNEFGEIRVSSWGERVVRITAEITVNAESETLAEQVAGLVEIRVTQEEASVEARTLLPEIKGNGLGSISVKYAVIMPRDANLAVDNFFGDVLVFGIDGSFSGDIQYGGLEINQAKGPVHARVTGEFPVRVQGLRQGGNFRLQGTTAEFSDIAGEVLINYSRGSVTVRRPGDPLQLSISGDNGGAHLILPPESNPDFRATVMYGRLESALDVSRSGSGPKLLARHPNEVGTQRISINTSFGDVVVGVEGADTRPNTQSTRENEVFHDTRAFQASLASGATLRIEAIIGNVTVQGVDAPNVTVEATRMVWGTSAEAAMNALDALELGTEPMAEGLKIYARPREDISLFMGESFRVDLKIQCPRDTPLILLVAEGSVEVSGVSGGLQLSLEKGEISLYNIKGNVQVFNGSGGLKAVDCSGPIEVEARHGTVRLENIYSDISVENREGRTLIDSPFGNVSVRHQGGDVRLLSLTPIAGDMDLLVEDGNVSAILSVDSDANLSLKATGGLVQSAIALSGNINRETQEFFGRLNQGTHRVRLEALNGSIFLN